MTGDTAMPLSTLPSSIPSRTDGMTTSHFYVSPDEKAVYTTHKKKQPPTRMVSMEHLHDMAPQGSILVWAEDYHAALPLLHMARRKARELGVPWEIVHVETRNRHAYHDSHEARQALHMLTLAEQMGAKSTHIIARNARLGIGRLLAERQHNRTPVQMLVIGYRTAGRWKRLLGGNVEEYFNRMRLPMRVLAVETGDTTPPQRPACISLFRFRIIELINCIMAVAGATATIQLFDHLLPETFAAHTFSKPLIYLMACVFASGRYGLLAGMFTAATSLAVYHLLYVQSSLQQLLASPADIVNLAFYLTAAIVMSLFASQTFTQREAYAAIAQRTHALFQLHRVAMDYQTRAEAVEALHKEISGILEHPVAFFLPTALNPNLLEAAYPLDTLLTESEQHALTLCWQESKITGAGSPHAPDISWRFVPLVTSHGEVGVLGVHIHTHHEPFDITTSRLLNAVADQAALIIERFELGQQMEESRLRNEREKLRSMLLSSVSHDLKTPLASVIGALSVYQTMGTTLSEEHRTTLITTALEEAQRLDNFITNILDITRLESGEVEFRKEWVSPQEILRKVERRMRTRLRHHTLTTELAAPAIELHVDPASIEQMLQNLFDNAAKYTPAGTRIAVRGVTQGKHYVLEVRDHGGGIPHDKLDRIFDKYARLQRTDSQVAGTGLGLSICRCIVQAQGGSIEAANHPDGGAVFTLTFPQWRRPQQNGEAA